MAAAVARRPTNLLPTHQKMPVHHGDSTEGETDPVDESMDPKDESGGTVSEDEEVDDATQDDMDRFQASFKNVSQRFRLINRIGEGTFSTVYKAEDLLYDHYRNDWDSDSRDGNRAHYVAIKKIYVTSSPLRILNELELLHDLRDSANVCPLITAFRHQDQVIAVLPYFQHKDFRDYYRDFTLADIRIYFHNLFTAVRSVHEAGIIHRDIKPTNFLYSPVTQKGVLVDFGLAEREGTDYAHCVCCYKHNDRQRRIDSSVYAATVRAAQQAGQPGPKPTYPNNDQRPSRRANRAGTRGFRAPEVLLKCTAQTSLLDIWSCGVILLTFLTKRFPFFHSADDIDAFIELCSIFGKRKMKEVSLLHGQVLQTNLPTVTENGVSWEKVILWCTGRGRKEGEAAGERQTLSQEEREAVEVLRACLELDPGRRITAVEALEHPWLAGVRGEGGDMEQ